ncbi:MAG: acyloxyacyl hydrolase [Verrucomicrobia bacterium]|nr:acyloxyacyl hydrolase [Verrucomicrobiota bacterium]
MHLGGKFERQSRALSGISILFAGLLTICPAQAGDGDISASTTASKTSPSSQTTNSDDLASYIFVEDRITLEFMTGAMFSPSGIGPVVPVYNYQQNNVRLGGINDPLRGSFEAILEATGSYVWYSFGTYMVGATALIRYNFVQPDWIVVPYIQGGAGVIYTNARNWSDQDAIGANVEFTPQFAGGLRFLLDKNWTFNIEGAFQHISNANTSARNQGVNAYGGFVGFTYVFDKIWND